MYFRDIESCLLGFSVTENVNARRNIGVHKGGGADIFENLNVTS